MANILRWANKKAGQAVDVVSRGASRTVSQINPLDNGRTWQQVTPVNNLSARQQIGNQARSVGTGVGLGAIRSATGTAQGISGLVDLATPGLGTSRVSQGLDSFAKTVDATAKAQGSYGAYRAFQPIGDIAQFAAGGAIIKAAAQLPKVAKFTGIVSKSPVARPVINAQKKLDNIILKGGRASIPAVAARKALSGTNLVNMAVDAQYNLGQEASKGRDISRGDVAVSVLPSIGLGVGVPAIGQAIKVSGKASVPALKAGANTTVKIAKASTPSATIDRGLKAAGDNNYIAMQRELDDATAEANMLSNMKDAPAARVTRANNRITSIQKSMERYRRNKGQKGAIGRNVLASNTSPEGTGGKQAQLNNISNDQKIASSDGSIPLISTSENVATPQGSRNIQPVLPVPTQSGRIQTQLVSSTKATKSENGATSKTSQPVIPSLQGSSPNVAPMSVSSNGSIAPTGQRIRANDRGNIGTIVAQNSDGSVQVRFTNRKDRTTFTKTMQPDQFTALNKTSKAAQIPQLPATKSERNNLKSPAVNALVSLPVQQIDMPTPPQTKGPQILLDRLQTAGTTSGNNTPNGTKLQAQAPLLKPTKYANDTAPKSDVVSDELGTSIKKGAPSYEVQNETSRLASSNQRINELGPENFIKDLDQRLDVENGKITSQDVTDTQSIAAMLDAAGDPDSLLKATQLYDRLSEHLTAAGQTVQAASLIARRSPQGLKFQAQRTFAKNGVKLTPEKIKELNGYIDAVRNAAPNSEAMAIARDNVQYFIAKNTPSNTADKIVNFWRSGLLTAPTTTFGALAGNSFATIQRKLWTNPIATFTDMVLSLGTGKRSRALAIPGAFGSGAKRGLSNVNPLTKNSQYWKTGYDPMNPMANEQTVGTNGRRINYGEGRLGKAVGTYVNGVYKVMGAADQPFRYGAYDEVMSSLARTEAINAGLKGEARDQFVKNFIANPPESAVQRATDEALDATFQDPTALAGLVQSAKQGLRQKGFNKSAALVDFLIPFSGVPSSVAARVIRNTPIGTANQLIKQIINVKKGEGFDQRLMSQAIAEGSVGVPIVAAGFALAQNDMFNGAYPSDPKERQKWTDQNRQENSVKIGGRWYSLNYIQPFGTLLAVGAGIAQAEGENGENPALTDYLSQATKSGVQSFAGQSYLEGLTAPLEALNNPEQEASRYLASAASGIVPNFIRSAARASDTVQRDATGVVDGIKGAIPGLRDDLPAKIGSDGQPLPNKDNFLNMYANPLKPSIAREGNAVVQETGRLLDNKLGVSAAPVKKLEVGKETVKLDKKQQEAHNKALGAKRNELWSNLISSDAYKSMSDENKQKALQKAAQDASAVQKAKTLTEIGRGDLKVDLTKKQEQLQSGKAPDYTKVNTKGESGGTSAEVSAKITPYAQKVLNEYNSLDETKRQAKINNEPSYEWKVAKSKLENDIAAGKITEIQRQEREDKIAELDAKKTYSKEARDLYNKGADFIERYLDNKGSDKLVDEIMAIDQLEVNMGKRKKPKLQGAVLSSGKRTGRKSATGRSKKPKAIPLGLLKSSITTPKIGRAKQSRIAARTPGRPNFKARKGGSMKVALKTPKFAGKYV